MSSPEAPRPKITLPFKRGGEKISGKMSVPANPLEASLPQQHKSMQPTSLQETGRNVTKTSQQEQLPIVNTRQSGRELTIVPSTPAQQNILSTSEAQDQIHSQEQRQYTSYKDYMLQTGGRYIDHIYGDPLADADRDYITRTYNEYLLKTAPILNQQHRDDLIERKLEGRMRGTFEMDGKTVTLFEAFQIYIARGELRKEEARRKGELDNYYLSLSLFHKEPYNTLTPEQKKMRRGETAIIVNDVLKEEVKEAKLPQIASFIKTDIWKVTSPAITIERDEKMVLGIQDDGTIMKRSRSGIAISYPREDLRKGHPKEEEKRESLFFGIGYFADRSQIAPEAQASISDEDLQKGVKSYFVQRMYTEKQNGRAATKTDIIAIPFAYSDNLRSFCKYLYEASESLAPEKTMPQPSRGQQQQAA